MRGLGHLSAGAVLLVDHPSVLIERPVSWLGSVRIACVEAGARDLRFYTPSSEASLTSALHTTGMTPNYEIALAVSARRLAAAPLSGYSEAMWSLREVATEDLWAVKAALHARTPERPDGKEADAESWVRLEREKVEAGYMTPYVLERDGEACGAFGMSFISEMLRFKNFFVAPAHRTSGAGSAALRLIARAAVEGGVEAVGCFVLPGSMGQRLYTRNGFVEVGRQLEWTTPAEEHAASRACRNAVG